MTWTPLPIIVIIIMIIALRLVAWWGLRLATRLFNQSATVLDGEQTREDIAELGSQLADSFPKTSRLLQKRLAPDRFAGLPLTLIAIAGIYIMALLGGLVEDLLEARELVQFDEAVNQLLGLIRSDIMIDIFSWITKLGDPAALIAVALVTTGLLWAFRRRQVITPLWITILGSQATTLLGKYALARPRPEFVTEVVASMPSFPSGHATSAMAVYGFIGYLVARELATQRQRFEMVYWSAVLIGLIGFSRVLLAVHYVSDIAAGFLVGGFWLLVGFAIAEYRYRKTSN